MAYDVLIKGGRVIDASDIDATLDVAQGGRIEGRG